jgi:hypothetical protein
VVEVDVSTMMVLLGVSVDAGMSVLKGVLETVVDVKAVSQTRLSRCSGWLTLLRRARAPGRAAGLTGALDQALIVAVD